MLTLTVDDDGPGIPPDKRVEAFRPFVRLDNARNLDETGTGLGLAIALDIAHAPPFVKDWPALAPGLALIEPEADTLVAFNAAPGAVAPLAQPPYGPYAQALAEMLREPGLPLDEVFARVRARVAELTRGAQAPWSESRLSQDIVMLERGPDAPPPDLDALARRLVDLWQEQWTQIATDPAVAEGLLRVMRATAPPGPGHDGAGPSWAPPARPAPDDGGGGDAGLARRVAELEARVARLEAAGRGGPPRRARRAPP
jgi:hypothetical protein